MTDALAASVRRPTFGLSRANSRRRCAHRQTAVHGFDPNGLLAVKAAIEHRAHDEWPLFCYPSDGNGQPLIPPPTMISISAAIDKAVATAEGQTAPELPRRLRNPQQLIHEHQPVVVPPLKPFEIQSA